MIKLIASDLDGTLLLHGAQELNPEVYDIILKLKEKGITFISASGRQLESQQNLFRPIADQISYIAENGAVCVHEGKIIATSGIERDLAMRILKCISELPHCKPVVSCISSCYILSGDDDYLYHLRHVLNNVTTAVDSFEDIKEPILKIAYFDEHDNIASAKYFQECFPTELKVVTSGNVWVDFLPFTANKGVALQTILETLQISPDEAISFGDQQNDIEMLTFTGTSYAMEGAVPEAKACADAITDSVEKTLLELLERL